MQKSHDAYVDQSSKTNILSPHSSPPQGPPLLCAPPPGMKGIVIIIVKNFILNRIL